MTKKTEESKCTKGNFTSIPPPHTHIHTVTAIELQSNKKVAPPPPLSKLTPPFQGYPLILAKFLVPPQVFQICLGLQLCTVLL